VPPLSSVNKEPSFRNRNTFEFYAASHQIDQLFSRSLAAFRLIYDAALHQNG